MLVKNSATNLSFELKRKARFLTQKWPLIGQVSKIEPETSHFWFTLTGKNILQENEAHLHLLEILPDLFQVTEYETKFFNLTRKPINHECQNEAISMNKSPNVSIF